MAEKFNFADMTLVVGLGNPGSEFEGTYHNAGWGALDALAAAAPFRSPRGKRFSFARLPSGVPLVKSRTFMNESGSAVGEARSYFSARDASTLLVIHDDSDLPLGTWKVQFGRGAAGHKGVQSVIARLGTTDFWRIRVGVRSPEPARARRKAGSFVLSRPTGKKAALLAAAYDAIAALAATESRKE